MNPRRVNIARLQEWIAVWGWIGWMAHKDMMIHWLMRQLPRRVGRRRRCRRTL